MREGDTHEKKKKERDALPLDHTHTSKKSLWSRMLVKVDGGDGCNDGDGCNEGDVCNGGDYGDGGDCGDSGVATTLCSCRLRVARLAAEGQRWQDEG